MSSTAQGSGRCFPVNNGVKAHPADLKAAYGSGGACSTSFFVDDGEVSKETLRIVHPPPSPQHRSPLFPPKFTLGLAYWLTLCACCSPTSTLR